MSFFYFINTCKLIVFCVEPVKSMQIQNDFGSVFVPLSASGRSMQVRVYCSFSVSALFVFVSVASVKWVLELASLEEQSCCFLSFSFLLLMAILQLLQLFLMNDVSSVPPHSPYSQCFTLLTLPYSLTISLPTSVCLRCLVVVKYTSHVTWQPPEELKLSSHL